MATEGIPFRWRWNGGTISTILEVIWGMSVKNAQDDAGNIPGEKEIEALKRHREMYEEAREAFDAIIHVIDRGYVELGE